MVSELLDDGKRWNWQKIHCLLPEFLEKEIRQIHITDYDELSWNGQEIDTI